MKEQGYLLTCDACGKERFLKVISCIPEISDDNASTVWEYAHGGHGWTHIFDGTALGKDYCPECRGKVG